MFNFIKKVQELFLCEEHIVLMHRFVMTKYRYYLISLDGEQMEEIDVSAY